MIIAHDPLIYMTRVIHVNIQIAHARSSFNVKITSTDRHLVTPESSYKKATRAKIQNFVNAVYIWAYYPFLIIISML